MTLVGLLCLLGRWGYDDPYITYRYASNLMAGHGLVFNVGQRTLSTTTPLYAMLLAASGLTGRALATFSTSVSIVSLVAAAGILAGWARHRGERATGLIAALLLSLSPLLLTTFSGEMCLYLMLILAGFFAHERSHLTAGAAALALAAMVRPEGVTAGIALGLLYLVRRRRLPWRPVLLYLALIGIWYAGLWWYFGSPIPLTLLAKQNQARLEGGTPFWVGLLQRGAEYVRQPAWWLHATLALIGMVYVAAKARHWSLLLGWTWISILAYTSTGVSSYFWYFAALAPGFAVLIAEGTVALARGIANLGVRRLEVTGVTLLILVGLTAPLLGGALGLAWLPGARLKLYQEIGTWLNDHTAPHATVGALEVGVVGYYAQRPMIDFSGLIQPEVARQLGSSHSFLDSMAWAVQHFWPDYVVLPRPAGADLAGAAWFRTAYSPMHNFANEGSLWITVYGRTRGLAPWSGQRSTGTVTVPYAVAAPNGTLPARFFGSMKVGQTFKAPLPGLSRIDVSLDGSLGPCATCDQQEIVFHLQRTANAPTDLVTRAFRLSDVNPSVPYRVQFHPLRDSLGQSYYFYLESPGIELEKSIAVRYTPNPVLEGRNASLNGRPLRGNLQFRSYYSPTALEKADLLLARLGEGRPGLLATKWFYAILAVVYLSFSSLLMAQAARDLALDWKVPR